MGAEAVGKLKAQRMSVAACAAALAASFGLAGPAHGHELKTLDKVGRYCMASWRNAGIHPQDWSDCTQDAMTSLLERVSAERLGSAVVDPESPERRELKRAIWRTIQRWRRTPRPHSLNGSQLTDGSAARDDLELSDWLVAALQTLSARQQHILSRWSEGYSIDEIAEQLGIAAARVSDEKYKALRKLHALLAHQ
jgi:RNA polymerase sigma factor (sigma-70 family)